jgi:type II secretory pathway component PulM
VLDESSVISYLTERKLLQGEIVLGNATVEVLTGGVSCVVLAVKSAEREIVVKQALPELKTKAKWVADQRRAIVEAEAMRVYQSITPDSVPELIDCDEANFTLTMSRLPNTCTNWKQDMLEGRIHPEMGEKLGKILAQWHNATAVDAAIKAIAPVNPETTYEVTGGFNRPPLESSSTMDLYERAEKVAKKIGLPALGHASVGGASDGNFAAAAGAQVLDGLGAVGSGAHAKHEWVDISTLEDRSKLLNALIKDLLNE